MRFIRVYKQQSTHGNYDHMGEAINLVENYRIEKVIFNYEYNCFVVVKLKVTELKKNILDKFKFI